MIAREAGVEEREKSGVGAAFTVSDTEAIRCRPPLVAVIVSGNVPGGVVVTVVTVMVDVPVPVTDDGLNVAAAPAGNPPALNVTVPVNPPDGVTVTVYVVLAP